MSGLDDWIAGQYGHAAAMMRQSISATALVKTRPGFGQTIVPKKGSVLASPVPGAYDPDPDYFFHWYRDAALVMEALRLLYVDGTLGEEALADFCRFVDFSFDLATLDGRAQPPAHATPDFTRYLRGDLAAVHGDAVAADTRVNPDGTLDISDWPRPQHDGPALRALTLLRWMGSAAIPGKPAEAMTALLRTDLDFVLARARLPCFDIWEEEMGLHYYTLRVSAAALSEGASWLEQRGEPAAACRDEAEALMRLLNTYWRTDGFYGSRAPSSAKDLDISVILAALHAGGAYDDARMTATLEHLTALFDAAYVINANRPPGRAPAMGRYAGDVYYSGGAYYFSTLAAAEFHFRNGDRRAGDGFLETVRAFTPPSGDLSEQFDRSSGSQTSARHLAWSYAAFITCITARRACPR